LTLFIDFSLFWVLKTHFRIGRHEKKKNAFILLSQNSFVNPNSIVRHWNKIQKWTSPNGYTGLLKSLSQENIQDYSLYDDLKVILKIV
jgi:hypothetical protein